MKFNIFIKKFFPIIYFIVFSGIVPLKTIQVKKYNNSHYIFLNDLTKKFEIEQTYDIITKKGKLFYKSHYAIYNVKYSLMIIDNIIYNCNEEVIKRNGEILLPVYFAKKIINSFFPDIMIFTKNKILTFKNKIKIEYKDKKENIEKKLNYKINFIVIDPGHGGKDPGAISKNKLKEKNITLKISKQLGFYLTKKMPGMKIIFTRNNDVFVELSERTEKANRLLENNKGGLFISIHVNASISRKISGYETYFLSQNPTNEEARKTAALENNVVFFEEKKSKKYEDFDYIEATMKTTQILKESSMLANDIQKSILQRNSLFVSRGVRKADFFVLRGVMMPAVLVEVGFITNYKEVMYLIKKSYQKKLALGISEGIVKFIKKYNSGKTLITLK